MSRHPDIDKYIDDLDERRLPKAIDVLLVGEAQNGDPGAVNPLTNQTEDPFREVNHIHHHELIDLAVGLDEVGDETVRVDAGATEWITDQ